jgi:hypothetical protein
LAHGAVRIEQDLRDLLAMVKEYCASLGQAKAARGAVQELHPQALLELAQLAADGGFRQAQGLARCGEAARLHHFQKHENVFHISQVRKAAALCHQWHNYSRL